MTAVDELCAGAHRLASAAGRDDLAARVAAAAIRVRRPATVIVVIGEFKQGKSSLVNGLVGQFVCPVDDDLATSALTVLHHSPSVEVTAYRRIDGKEMSASIEPSKLASLVSERGNPGNELGVVRVEVGLPSPLLESGLVVVDSPGVGGMNAGQAAATLAFLPFADGLLFVSDASAELAAPEVAFLHQARQRCPNIVVCLSKIDLYPQWRRIADIDRHHLDANDVDAPIVGVSSVLRQEAMVRRERSLNDESGFPALLDLLHEQVLDPARDKAVLRAESEAIDAIDQLRTTAQAGLDSAIDPATAKDVADAAERTKARFEALKAVNGKWASVLNDRLTELGNEVNFAFRELQRELGRTIDERLEHLSTKKAWDELCTRTQDEVAHAVGDVYARIESGATAAAAAVEQIVEAELDLPMVTAATGVDLSALWQLSVQAEKIHDGTVKAAARGVGGGVSTLRGLQSGISLLSLLGVMLHSAAATFSIANPIGLGVGTAFGVKAAVDQRRRRVAEGRQKVKVMLHQFLDEIAFRVGNELTNTLRAVQQKTREIVNDRIVELQRTVTEAAQQAYDVAQLSQSEREKMATELRSRLAELDTLRAAVAP